MAERRLSCCLTFDFDGPSLWLGSFGSNNPSVISRGEFGAVAIPRLLALLRRYDLRATFCIPGHTVYAYPDLVKTIRDAGHELAHHGWVHENPAEFDLEGERRNLERGLEALAKVTGVRPVGYRSPSWDFSLNTVTLLLEYDFIYDSSCMGNDFYPYYLRQGDRWSVTEPAQFGRVTGLVELPVTWGLDDFPAFEPVWAENPGLSAPSVVAEIWQGDFDYAYANCPGGIYTLTLHPQVIGRGHRMLMLERLIDYFKSHSGVVFETMSDYARWWRAQELRSITQE